MSHHPRPLPPVLVPEPGELGLLSADPRRLAEQTVRAWEVFTQLAHTADLAAATRSRGNLARHLLASVGYWDDSRHVSDMVADAHAGVAEVESQSHADRRLRAAHGGDPDEQILEAVDLAAARIRSWFTDGRSAEESRLVTASPLGPVPIGTYMFASAFHLAVTARDLVPAGAAPSQELDGLGVAALVDSAGAVAARLDATASIAAMTPEVTAATAAHATGWRTLLAPAGTKHLGPGVQGPAGLLIDVAAGRVDFVQVARSLRLRHPQRLVAMSVVLDGIPDLPAAAMLRRAGQLARRLPW